MKHSARGFTLIELLVVIAIIGILSTVVLASLSTARMKSRDARRIADIKQLQLALELYRDSNNKYPTTLAALTTGGYMSVIPKDPSTGSNYIYAANDPAGGACNPSSYHIGAVLEDTTNNALTQDPDAAAATTCTGTQNADFSGTSQDCAVTAGTAQPGGTEKCYDGKP